MAIEFVIIRLRKEGNPDSYLMHWQFEDCILHLTENLKRAGMFTVKEAETIIRVTKGHVLDTIKVVVDL